MQYFRSLTFENKPWQSFEMKKLIESSTRIIILKHIYVYSESSIVNLVSEYYSASV